jgi:heme/copper-type cytochrome/quinol oxidase subunit 2
MTPGAARGQPVLATLALLATFVAGGAGVAASPAGPDETIEVVASREGFRPRVVNVRKGEPVRLLLSTADGEHCFAVDALRIEKRIVSGQATVLDLTPERSGTYPFYCCLEPGEAGDSENGRLVIID